MMALQKLEVLRSDFLFGKNKSINSKNNLPQLIIDNDSVLLDSAHEFKQEFSEDGFANNKEELKIFITTDQELLKQYYKLREISYRTEFGFENYDGSQNEFDVSGKILVAVENKKVVGGMRFMLSSDKKNLSAEIEGTKFTYDNLFKSMNIENPSYCEISAIVVAKEYRDRSVIEKMFDRSIIDCLKDGCNYLVGVSTAPHCRVYRMIFKKFGHNSVVKMDYPWIVRQDHNNLKEFPIVVSILTNNF